MCGGGIPPLFFVVRIYANGLLNPVILRPAFAILGVGETMTLKHHKRQVELLLALRKQWCDVEKFLPRKRTILRHPIDV